MELQRGQSFAPWQNWLQAGQNKWEILSGTWGTGPAQDYKGALRMMFGMRVRWGLLRALIILPCRWPPRWRHACVCALSRSNPGLRSPSRATVVSRRDIRSIFKADPMAALNQAAIDDGPKALIETGLFQDVRINNVGRRLV